MSETRIVGPAVSPFVVKTLAAADYKGFAYDHDEYVSIRELGRYNATTGKVPVALFDGEAVYDSTLILRRFDEIHPDKPLVSSDPAVAAHQRILEDWADESLYWSVQAFRWHEKNEHRTIAQNARFVPAPMRIFAKPILRRLVGRQPRAQGMGRLPYEMLVRELGKRLDDLVVLLGRNPFFCSDKPSIADFAIYGQLCTGSSERVTPDFAEIVEQRGALEAWRSRLETAMGNSWYR
ncbi:MAG: glutathione S-transferase family protein [Gammaproteobacteria bacterium]|nr:glutathione S-transferase family protein [Gammaproteobacteria bacterium]MYE82792.1 glutathione S-transferase family protein [Gammaproteobacteria bacterium]